MRSTWVGVANRGSVVLYFGFILENIYFREIVLQIYYIFDFEPLCKFPDYASGYARHLVFYESIKVADVK